MCRQRDNEIVKLTLHVEVCVAQKCVPIQQACGKASGIHNACRQRDSVSVLPVAKRQDQYSNRCQQRESEIAALLLIPACDRASETAACAGSAIVR